MPNDRYMYNENGTKSKTQYEQHQYKLRSQPSDTCALKQRERDHKPTN